VSWWMRYECYGCNRRHDHYQQAPFNLIAALHAFGSGYSFLDARVFSFIPTVALSSCLSYSLCLFLISFRVMRTTLSAVNYSSRTMFMYK
jgi:hypothetical protein